MASFSESWRNGGTGRGAYILTGRVAADIPLIARGVAGQTANIFEVENSAGTNLFTVDPTGNVSIAGSISAVVSETVTGDIALTGNLTVNGNTTLGNAAADTVTVTGTPTFSAPVTMTSTLAVTGQSVFSSFISAPIVSLPRRGSTPATIGTTGRLYTFAGDVDTTELFYLDAAGNAVQITDAGALEGSSLFWDDDEYIRMGNTAAAPDVRLGWNTTQTVDGWYFGTSDEQNTMIIAENGDRAFDFAHAAQTNPTLFIHSAVQNTSQWISFAHSGAAGAGVITTGTGPLTLAPNGASLNLTNVAAGVFIIANTGDNSQLQFRTKPTTSVAVPAVEFRSDALVAPMSAVAGTQTFFELDFTLNQGGTAGYRGIFVNVTETTTGSGTKLFADFQVGAASRLTISNTGALTITEGANTSGTPSVFVITGAAHTGITAATETIGLNFNQSATKTWAAGAGPLATQREVFLQRPTYAGDAGGALTITTATLFSLGGNPVDGANMTITTSRVMSIEAASSGAGTLTNTIGLDIADQSIAAATSGFAIRVQSQTANATTTRAIELVGTGVNNAIRLGASSNIYAPGAEIIRFMDSTDAGGVSLTLTAGGNQTFTTITANTSFVFTQATGTTGSTGFTFNVGAHTAITAATEIIGAIFASVTKTWAAGAGPLAAQREVVIQRPTYVGNAAGALTITTATLLSLGGNPVDGADMTITTSRALSIEAASSGAGTLTNTIGLDIADQSIAAATTGYAIRIQSQTANATTTRAVEVVGTGVNNAIRLGGSPNIYSSGAEVIRFDDSTAARGIAFTLTAAGAQDIAVTAGNFQITGVAGAEVVFNEASADIDVRMESDGNVNMFHLNAGTNGVGVGQVAAAGVVLTTGWDAATMGAGTTVARHFQTQGNITELAGAAITDIVGAYFNTFTITDGGGAETVGTVATVYIVNAPTAGTAPTNGPYAFFSDAGTNRLDGQCQFNSTTLRLDASAIANFVAANDTAGGSSFLECQGGGVSTGIGRAGGGLTITMGAGSAAAGASGLSGSDGGALSFTGGGAGAGDGAGIDGAASAIAFGTFNGFTLTQAAKNEGSATGFTWISGAHTDQTNSPFSDFVLNMSGTLNYLGGGGAIASANGLHLRTRTYSADAAQTITSASTLYIDAAPTTSGGNVTLTNSYAIFVDAGRVRFDGSYVGNRSTSAAGAYTVLPTDYIVGKTGITGGGDTVTLEALAGVDTGRIVIIKDESGAAGANNITIDGNGAETIDGAANAVINSNYGVRRLYATSTGWFTF